MRTFGAGEAKDCYSEIHLGVPNARASRGLRKETLLRHSLTGMLSPTANLAKGTAPAPHKETNFRPATGSRTWRTAGGREAGVWALGAGKGYSEHAGRIAQKAEHIKMLNMLADQPCANMLGILILLGDGAEHVQIFKRLAGLPSDPQGAGQPTC